MPRYEERTYRLHALTPVHIGTGERMSAEEYAVDGGELVRLDVPFLIGGSMSRSESAWRRFWMEQT